MLHISPPGRRQAALWRRVDQASDTDRPQPELTVAVGGSFARVRGAKVPDPSRATFKRGVILGFSGAARKRMLEMVASIRRAKAAGLPLFVTLTYPGAWPEDPAVWKRHLDTWLKRLDREYVGLSAIWKLEFQSRGAPHYHLLVFGARWIDPRWVSRSWYEVVGSGDERHLLAGTRVERVKSWRGVMYYASKYLAKKTVEGLVGAVGRYWGVYRRERLPIELITIPLTFGQFFRLRRILIRWAAGPGGAIAHHQTGGRKGYRHRIRSESQGLCVFKDYAQVVAIMRALA